MSYFNLCNCYLVLSLGCVNDRFVTEYPNAAKAMARHLSDLKFTAISTYSNQREKTFYKSVGTKVVMESHQGDNRVIVRCFTPEHCFKLHRAPGSSQFTCIDLARKSEPEEWRSYDPKFRRELIMWLGYSSFKLDGAWSLLDLSQLDGFEITSQKAEDSLLIIEYVLDNPETMIGDGRVVLRPNQGWVIDEAVFLIRSGRPGFPAGRPNRFVRFKNEYDAKFPPYFPAKVTQWVDEDRTKVQLFDKSRGTTTTFETVSFEPPDESVFWPRAYGLPDSMVQSRSSASRWYSGYWIWVAGFVVLISVVYVPLKRRPS